MEKSTYFFDFDGVLFYHNNDYAYLEYVESCLNLLWRKGCNIYVISNNRHVQELMPSIFERYIDETHHVSGEKVSKIRELCTFYSLDPDDCIFYDDTLEHVQDVENFMQAILVTSGELTLKVGPIEFKFNRKK